MNTITVQELLFYIAKFSIQLFSSSVKYKLVIFSLKSTFKRKF